MQSLPSTSNLTKKSNVDCKVTGQNHTIYQPLLLAAQRGDWDNAKRFIDRHPDALIKRITYHSRTVLHVAALCCQWGFILKLLDEYALSPESIAMQDSIGCTVLHFVAQGGSLKTTEVLVRKNAELLNIDDNDRDSPLVKSIWGESKELVWYLSLRTRLEPPSLPKIVRCLIQSGYLDIALYFVRKYPYLAIDDDDRGSFLLSRLTCESSYFFSGSNLGFVERWIYKFVHVEINNAPIQSATVNMEDFLESKEGFPALLTSVQPSSFTTQVFGWFKRILILLWKAIAQLAPCIKKIRDAKLKHQSAIELLNHVCEQYSSKSFEQILEFLRKKPIFRNAIANGIEEIVRALLQSFPDLVEVINPSSKRNILQAAIKYRQENIVNIVKEISPTITKNLCSGFLESSNTTLHLAGRLAPASKLHSVSGAALQMQNELQWFKEVEKMTHPYHREWRNDEDQTAKDVFRSHHEELAEQGEKWMKDTANSCMLITTLIATVLFAAAFTVPGGNVNDKGIPIFLRMNAFMVFIISDAVGLFSSLTSLLMFLAIITARYTIEDFLESLPKRLIIGLGSLFFAIVTMIIAFGATLTIVLSERWQWISVPITLLASFPVAIFVMLQLRLFTQMVQSTYGSGKFRP